MYNDMEHTRTLSIGVTINLGNYENLHLEVSDTAETKEAAASLRRFLASVLDDFAQNNASAKEAIDKYKERVLDDSESGRAEETDDNEFAGLFEDMEEPALAAEPKPAPVSIPKPEEEVAAEPVFVPEDEPENIPVEEPVPEIVTVPNPPAQKPPVQEVPAGEFICEKCGAPLTKVQRDVSKMFTGKVLCKKCFNGTR